MDHSCCKNETVTFYLILSKPVSGDEILRIGSLLLNFLDWTQNQVEQIMTLASLKPEIHLITISRDELLRYTEFFSKNNINFKVKSNSIK